MLFRTMTHRYWSHRSRAQFLLRASATFEPLHQLEPKGSSQRQFFARTSRQYRRVLSFFPIPQACIIPVSLVAAQHLKFFHWPHTEYTVVAEPQRTRQTK